MNTLRTTLSARVLVMALCFAYLVVMGGIAQATDQTVLDTLTYTFDTPRHEFVVDENGFSRIEMSGFESAGLPGDPGLPAAVHYIALPPGVPLDSVTLEINAVKQIELPGTHQIAPIGPDWPASGAIDIEPDWGPNEAAIVDGRNTLVYDSNTFFPASPVELETVSQMRKWRFAELRYQPVSYNPVNGRLRLTTQVTVTLHYQTVLATRVSTSELQDTLMDNQAAQILANFDEAQAWYRAVEPSRTASEKRPGYAIITTNQIVAASNALDAFITHKESLGFEVFLVTETDYGAAPTEQRAQLVRKWLQDHYKAEVDNIKYVLLIGNPDPYGWPNGDPDSAVDAFGDLPMLQVDNGAYDKYFDTYGTPTDFFFADLTGNWDLDGDGRFGEWEDHEPGGVDYWAEVYVGRIPVYMDQEDELWSSSLDKILRKTIDYQTSPDQEWRRSALLPMAFLNTITDGAELAESMKNDYLDNAGFETYRMYWHGTNCNSQFASEQDLAHKAVPEHWRENPYGIVAWYGHGWPLGTSLGFNYCYEGINSLDLIRMEDAPSLNDARPALTFQNSCSTGHPETKTNIGYALLKNGAVGTVSASRDASQGYGSDLAYVYVKHLVASWPTGDALYTSKASDSYVHKDAMAFNLYGDPSIQLLPGPANYWPIATGDEYTVDMNRSLTVPAPGVLANDRDLDGDPITALLKAPPNSGKVDLRSDGSFTYTPDPGWTGNVSFSYTATDGKVESDPARVWFEVIDPCAAVLGNAVANDCFTTGREPWRLSAQGYGEFSRSAVDPFAGDYSAHLSFDGVGSVAHLTQRGMTLLPDTTYEISFAAYSDGGQDMSVWVEQHREPYENYGLEDLYVDLGTSWAVYTTEFKTPNVMGEHDARVRFEFQPFLQTGAVYHIDRVFIRPLGESRVYFLGQDQTPGSDNNPLLVQELAWWYDKTYGDSWHRWNIGEAAESTPPAPDSTLAATTVNSLPRVYYLAEAPDGYHVHELAWLDDWWHHSDITASAGAPPAVTGSAIAAESFDGEPRVYYLAQVGSEHHVYELTMSGGQWHDTDITVAATNGTPAVADSSLAVVAVTGQPRVYFLSAGRYGNHVHELALKDTGWQDLNLKRASRGTLAAFGSDLAAIVIDGQPHVYYLAERRKGQTVHEIHWNGRRWQHTNVTRKARIAPPAIDGSALSVVSFEGEPHVYVLVNAPPIDPIYAETKWETHVADLTQRDGRWNYTDLIAAVDCIWQPVPESALSVANYGGSPSIYYQVKKGEELTIYELREKHFEENFSYWDCGSAVPEDRLPHPLVTSGVMSAISFTNQQLYVDKP